MLLYLPSIWSLFANSPRYANCSSVSVMPLPHLLWSSFHGRISHFGALLFQLTLLISNVHPFLLSSSGQPASTILNVISAMMRMFRRSLILLKLTLPQTTALMISVTCVTALCIHRKDVNTKFILSTRYICCHPVHSMHC